MSRVIIGHPARRNPDVSIVTIDPMPPNQVSFGPIREVLHEFLHDQARVGYASIQPCPFGQAYVKFNFYHDRGQLIHNSPHQFGGVRITFVEHDRGWNRRAVTLNYEVWLMVLGFNIDFWSDVHISKLLGDHGQLIAWEEDPNHLGRVLVKDRVVNLEEIPWFVVGTEGPGFHGDSWTFQTDIIQATMLGGLTADEDNPSRPDDIQQEFFDFFGYGQPGQGPFQGNINQPNNVEEAGNEGYAADWDLWPQHPNAAPGAEADAQLFNILVQLADARAPEHDHLLEFDLNQPADLPVEDPGVVENAPDPNPPVVNQALGDDIAEDIIIPSSDSEGEDVLPAPPPFIIPDDHEVNVFIPMDNGVPLQLIPDEIQENELLNGFQDEEMAEADQNF